MNWSVVLGLLGIVVSIGVGWFTYVLADRRARSQRHANAKVTILQELSKSLGENSVPSPAVLEATIRSVLRETADPRLKIDLDEILDDLVRQVTSDPFLDNERRRKLQADIENVREETQAKPLSLPPTAYATLIRLGTPRYRLLSSALGIVAGIATMVAITLPFLKEERLLSQPAFDSPAWLVGMVAGAVVVAALATFFGTTSLPDLLRRLFRLRR